MIIGLIIQGIIICGDDEVTVKKIIDDWVIYPKQQPTDNDHVQ